MKAWKFGLLMLLIVSGCRSENNSKNQFTQFLVPLSELSIQGTDPQGRLSAFPDSQATAFLQWSDGGQQHDQVRYSVSGVDGGAVSSDGKLTFSIPSTAATNVDLSFTVTATRIEDGATSSVTGTLRAIKPSLSLRKVIGSAGGIIADDTTGLKLQFPENSWPEGTQVSIYSGVDAQGEVLFGIDFQSPDPQFTGEFDLLLPEADSFRSSIVGSSRSIGAMNQRSNYVFNDSCVWRKSWAYFGNLLWSRLPYNKLSHRMVASKLGPLLFTIKPGSQLLSCDSKATKISKEIVIFVHGYTLWDGLGGGEGTWGQFPKLMQELGYTVFEFQFRSNARFQDIAVDLSRALAEIRTNTDQPINIIAHSFGGLVSRTYLQNYATFKNAITPIQKLVTIGTPHSGVSKTPVTVRGMLLPDGQDTMPARICGQLSCYQAGTIINPLLWQAIDTVYQTGEMGGIIADLNTPDLSHRLPDSLKVLALIGRTSISDDQKGDGLISFPGQRFSPNLVGKTLSSTGNEFKSLGGAVQETVLDGKYVHIGQFAFLGGEPEVAIANCPTANDCSQATFVATRDFLKQSANTGDTTQTGGDGTTGGDTRTGTNQFCTTITATTNGGTAVAGSGLTYGKVSDLSCSIPLDATYKSGGVMAPIGCGTWGWTDKIDLLFDAAGFGGFGATNSIHTCILADDMTGIDKLTGRELIDALNSKNAYLWSSFTVPNNTFSVGILGPILQAPSCCTGNYKILSVSPATKTFDISDEFFGINSTLGDYSTLSVKSHKPAEGATNIAHTEVIWLTFNSPANFNPYTFEGTITDAIQLYYLDPSNNPVRARISVSGTQSIFKVSNLSGFVAGKKYFLLIKAGLSAINAPSQKLQSEFKMSFTVQ